MSTNWTRRGVVAAALAASVAVAAAGVSYATTSTRSPNPPTSGSAVRTVTVEGTGTVTADPDTATVRLGVLTSSSTGGEAMEQLNASSDAMIEALIESGIAEEDIATTNLALRPRYNRGRTVVTGYQASMSVNVTIEEIDEDVSRVGTTIDAAQRAAGEGFTISGVSFTVADPEPLLEQARVDAGADARRVAEDYATGVDASVGEVLVVEQRGTSAPRIVLADAAPAFDADESGAARVAPGQLDLEGTVTATFVLL